ncbi:DUF4276 family protein [Parabacteroides sp. FAFU027]|uniref:DUF4276 family protein n=1 Tax=Parabacteroides sp. FAFU027 TaxID=2922715 RepID=UPI001FAFC11F|nr:DUF4276 family protein [Parabacteroides sp. FAFU027]
MEYRQLYIFVEGPDDERYINQVIKPILKDQYNDIKVIKYAKLPKVVVQNYIKTFNKQQSSDYLFLCDMDARGNSTCITKRKEKEQGIFGNVIDNDKMVIVKEEIESWYLAGITSDHLQKFKIKPFTDTQSITKEEFVRLIPKNFNSTNDFMVEVLKEYSIKQAQSLNSSLNYFITKHCIQE